MGRVVPKYRPEMKVHPNSRTAAVVLCFIGVCAGALIASRQKSPQHSNLNSQDQIARGQYVVEEIAKCTECHTPRDAQFQLDRSRWLQGASVWITPVVPQKDWADRAPGLAGLGGFTDQQILRVLENGQGVNGQPIQPPMHIYHMHHDDALAIIAYLRSLPTPTVHR